MLSQIQERISAEPRLFGEGLSSVDAHARGRTKALAESALSALAAYKGLFFSSSSAAAAPLAVQVVASASEPRASLDDPLSGLRSDDATDIGDIINLLTTSSFSEDLLSKDAALGLIAKIMRSDDTSSRVALVNAMEHAAQEGSAYFQPNMEIIAPLLEEASTSVARSRSDSNASRRSSFDESGEELSHQQGTPPSSATQQGSAVPGAGLDASVAPAASASMLSRVGSFMFAVSSGCLEAAGRFADAIHGHEDSELDDESPSPPTSGGGTPFAAATATTALGVEKAPERPLGHP